MQTINNLTSHYLIGNVHNDSRAEVPRGMYRVTIIADGQRYTQRVIKQ